MQTHIRRFQPTDLDVVLDIAVAAWRPIVESSRNIIGPKLFELVYPNPEQRKRDQVAKACRDESSTSVWVAELDGTIAGFITVDIDAERKVGEIGNNAVDPAQQGRGVGTAMYSFAIERMKEAGMRSAVVGTGGDESHAPARRAYEKAGFSGGFPSIMYHMEIE